MIFKKLKRFGQKIFSGLNRGGRKILSGLVPSINNKTNELNEEQKLALYLSKESYKKPNERRGINNYKYIDNLSNIYEAVFIDFNDKIIYIAFRGTKINDINDIREDLKIISQDLGQTNFNSVSQRIRSGKDLIDKLKSNYRDYKIKLCGHSLGSRISTELGRKNNIPSIGFNTGGLDIIGNLTDRMFGRKNIQQITSGKDVISLGSLLSPYTTIYKNDKITNPFRTHSLKYYNS